MSDVTPAKADETPHDSPVEPEPSPVEPSLVEPVETPHDSALESEPSPLEPSLVEPVETPDVPPNVPAAESTPELVEPATPVAPETAEVRAVTAEPIVTESDRTPLATGDVAPVAVAPAAPVAAAAPQQMYLDRPLPPKRRGNRGIGILLSIVGTAIFAGVYALVVALINHLQNGGTFGGPGIEFTNIFSSAYFSVAVGAFLILMILMVLVLNRAGWWAHVLGSLVLAVALYFVAIGGLMFIGNVLGYSRDPLTFASVATSPWVIAAAVVAREVSIWTGLVIAARGRRVKARNIETRSAFEREQEAKKAEYAGTAATA